eukprot:scaffold128400_cov75-Phaeocystis_antarctica.AAC.3
MGPRTTPARPLSSGFATTPCMSIDSSSAKPVTGTGAATGSAAGARGVPEHSALWRGKSPRWQAVLQYRRRTRRLRQASAPQRRATLPVASSGSATGGGCGDGSRSSQTTPRARAGWGPERRKAGARDLSVRLEPARRARPPPRGASSCGSRTQARLKSTGRSRAAHRRPASPAATALRRSSRVQRAAHAPWRGTRRTLAVARRTGGCTQRET